MAKVLVVDDQQVLCDLFFHTLKVEGHDVKFSTRVDEALKLLKKEKFDVIFLDVVLKEMNGLELYKELRKINKTVPVVMITGFRKQVDKLIKEALDLGVYKCLEKPFDIDEITGIIKEIMQK